MRPRSFGAALGVGVVGGGITSLSLCEDRLSHSTSSIMVVPSLTLSPGALGPTTLSLTSWSPSSWLKSFLSLLRRLVPESLLSLLDALRPEWFLWLVASSASLGDALCSLMLPTAIGHLVEALSESHGESLSLSHFSELFALILAKACLSFLSSSSVRAACERMSCRLRQMCYRQLLRHDVAYFDATGALQASHVLHHDIRDIKLSVGRIVQDGIGAAVSVVGGMFVLYNTSAPLSVALACAVPMWVGLGTLVANRLKKKLQVVRDADADLHSHATETLLHIRTVKANGTEDWESERFNREAERVRDDFIGVHTLLGGFLALAGVTASAMTALMLVVGSQWDPSLTAGSLTGFLMTAARVQQGVQQISILASDATRSSEQAHRIWDVLKAKPSIPIEGGKVLQRSSDAKGAKVTFENVSFAYPTRPEERVFKDLSLRVEPGECVALVGRSGAGKTSLSLLLLRFYDVSQGRVCVDDVDIRELDPHYLRSLMGVVEQRPLLFRGSLLDNIRYGRWDASDEEVLRAAHDANCDEFVSRLPDGYKTVMQGDGGQLSGGQMQRVAIARALLRQPAILILDEATSNLDHESEAAIQEALSRVKSQRNCTIVIIAHRPSALKNCDKIAVIDKGQVVEFGAVADLLEKSKGYFSDLMRKQ